MTSPYPAKDALEISEIRLEDEEDAVTASSSSIGTVPTTTSSAASVSCNLKAEK
jgi:hypothetical protein